MNQRTPEKVIPFAPAARDQRQNEGDPLDRSGMAIVAMLQEAVDAAKYDCDRAMDIAHKLSLKLREAEERVVQLESSCRHYQERASRAEQWMHRIQTEIEHRFFQSGSNGKAGSGHGATSHAGNGHTPR